MTGMTISRLKDRADFLNAKRGARSHERAFVLQVVRRAESSPVAPEIARFGFTVTKKIGNAVTRNRIKRRLREVVRLTDLPQSIAGCDIVLIARETAATEPFERLQNSLIHGLTQGQTRAKKSNRHPNHAANRGRRGGSGKDNIANRADKGQNPPNGR